MQWEKVEDEGDPEELPWRAELDHLVVLAVTHRNEQHRSPRRATPITETEIMLQDDE